MSASADRTASQHPERPGTGAPTSPRSDRVKAVRRLTGRSARLREGAFVAEGPQSVREAVLAHRDRALGAPGAPGAAPVVQAVYATDQALDRHPDIVAGLDDAGLRAVRVAPEVLAAMTDTVTPQGIIAVCRLIDAPLATVIERRPRLVAVLAQVRDPGNAGTVIRAADAAGADAVILTDSSVDVHNPKCVRSTAGSLFHLPVVTGVPLAEAVAGLHAAGLVVVAADGAGALDLDELQDDGPAGLLAGRVAWLFGNEAWGLPEADRALADAVVRVPVHGRAESLNLATAATVCLYATARVQRRTG
ncbi:MAG: RNA methyltransferase [Kineosporiaceae bacterium]|nr:RNA methyltransferase [Kineosporiaceae bacterium]MBK8076998.1 RNA methyltransferase [Kineosporiaceae bacterium]